MDIHTATEVSYKNGYAKAVTDLRENTVWTKIGENKYQCTKCQAINNRPSNFCPDCGRAVDY